MYGVIQQKYATHCMEIQQILDRLTARDRREFVLPGRWKVSRSGPRVFRETNSHSIVTSQYCDVTVLWRHNNGPGTMERP